MEYRGIGLVEVIWKMITTIINNLLRTVIFLCDALHGFVQGRGAVKATLEAKLAQHLAVIFHEQLFHLFLYVKESYESLD